MISRAREVTSLLAILPPDAKTRPGVQIPHVGARLPSNAAHLKGLRAVYRDVMQEAHGLFQTIEGVQFARVASWLPFGWLYNFKIC